MSKTAPFPNFFIIGVPKSGTTSLHRYLNQHPQVFTSKAKEPNTLFYRYIDGDFSGPSDYGSFVKFKTMRQYLDLFKDAVEATAIGESSFYLYSDNARNTLHEIAPSSKFIVILRNPADRAYSNFLHMLRIGEEPVKDFREALALEEDRKALGARPFYYYKSNGFYTKRLKKYLDTFPRNQFFITRYENWRTNNQKILREVLEFLNVDPHIPIDTKTEFAVRSVARIPAIASFLHKQPPVKNILEAILRPLLPKSIRYRIWSYLTNINQKPAPMFDPQLREELLEFYRQDIIDLQDLIEMDLSHWLE
jgi:hypothetical protein